MRKVDKAGRAIELDLSIVGDKKRNSSVATHTREVEDHDITSKSKLIAAKEGVGQIRLQFATVCYEAINLCYEAIIVSKSLFLRERRDGSSASLKCMEVESQGDKPTLVCKKGR
ncbi:hypothetical protein CsSME_00010714 [Camellia sinensis var. sinensis]